MSAIVDMVKSIPNFSSDKVDTFIVPGEAAMINRISYYIPDERGTWDIVDEEFADFKLKKWTEDDSGLPESSHSSIDRQAPVNIFPKNNTINNRSYEPNYDNTNNNFNNSYNNNNYNNNYNNNHNNNNYYEQPRWEEPAKETPKPKPSYEEKKPEPSTETIPPSHSEEKIPEPPAPKEPETDPGIIEYNPGLNLDPPSGGDSGAGDGE